MDELSQTLAGHRQAVASLVALSERCADAWTTPRAPGKWSPSQLIEHVAVSLDEAANVVAGGPSKFPRHTRHHAQQMPPALAQKSPSST